MRLRYERLDLHDGHRSTRGSMDTAPAVIPAPQPMTSTDRGLAGCQRRQVSQHSLEPHIPRNIRSLDLSGDVKRQSAVRKTRDSHGRVHAFACIKDVALVRPRSPRSGHARRAVSREVGRCKSRDCPPRGSDARWRRRPGGSMRASGNRSSRPEDNRQNDQQLLRALRSHPGNQ